MNSVPVLVEAKKEYTNQLQQILAPRLYEGLKSIYDDLLKVLSDEMMQHNMQSTSAIKAFQRSLKDIPGWNQDMIKNEYNRIEKTSKCDYFEDLLEAVFTVNIKILTSVQINNKVEVNVNVPQATHFIHKCYIECSKELSQNPYIFDMSRGLTPKEKHSNLRDSLNVINSSINNAIRGMLPIRDILKQGILEDNKYQINNNEDAHDQENESEETQEDESEEIQEDESEEIQDSISEDNQYTETENTQQMNNNNIKTIIIQKDQNKNDIIDNIDVEEFGNNDEEVEDDQESDDDQEFKNTEMEEQDTENNENVENIENNEDDKIIILEEPVNKIDNDVISPQNISLNENDNQEISLVGGVKEIELNTVNKEEEPSYDNKVSELKQINLSSSPILKKIDSNQKIEKPNTPGQIRQNITELIKPSSQINKSIHINSKLRKINQQKIIKNKLLGNNNSFYQKKYDQNLANYNYTSESYLDEDDTTNMTKNKLNIDFNSSDEEDNSPVILG